MNKRRIIIYPYKPYSQSAKKLAEAVGGKRIYYGHKFKPRQTDVVINWGNSKQAKWTKEKPINNPFNVSNAINKFYCFTYLKKHDVSIPEHSSSKNAAKQWLENGGTVVVRKKLTGNSGDGIVLVSPGQELPDAPLYTLYKKKKKEFRVHVFNGEVIDIQEKRKRKGAEEVNQFIRNIGQGWVFCRDNIEEPKTLREVAINAIKALGLVFGGVDVIWNQKEDKCYVLEVNTAPGLEGSTVDSYAKAIKGYLNV